MTTRTWLEELTAAQQDIFLARNATSYAVWSDAVMDAPEGVATQLHLHGPHPIAIARGAGAHVWDMDNSRYSDFHLGFGTMVMGHADPQITAAIRRRAERGTHFGAITPEAGELARILCERHNQEQCQLTNSGGEATALAVRIARAHTGRAGVVKVEGGYHGTTDPLMVSTHPSLREAGPERSPTPVAWGACHSPDAHAHTHVVPFNDLDAARRVLAQVRPACLVVEPIMLNVGFVMPDDGYLDELAALCTEAGALLIFDEVKTGCTVAYGGAGAWFGITPDLVCLGKGIGGGLPMGAVLAGADLMEQVAEGDAPHYSTFAGNPLACAAGIVALTQVLTPEAYLRMGAHTARLRNEGDRLLTAAGIGGHIAGLGAKGTLVLHSYPLRNYRDYEVKPDHDLGYLYWLVMVNNGIFLSPGQDEQWTLSAAHADADIDLLLAALGRFCDLVADAR